jgi:acetyl-CoA carboxylase biotin carboxyl carrier protein
MPLDINDLRELLSTLNQTDVTELTLKGDDFELSIRRGAPPRGVQGLGVPGPEMGMSFPPPVPLSPTVGASSSSRESGPSAIPSSSPVSTAPAAATEKLLDVTSPMVGTFYQAPAPEEPAFVKLNDRIRVGQTVCIIEAMKLMNEIESEVAGEVVEILVQNAQPVEFGQVLMRVRPN